MEIIWDNLLFNDGLQRHEMQTQENDMFQSLQIYLYLIILMYCVLCNVGM